MAEVVGLVVSGIPIAIWALEKYAEPLETYKQYGVKIIRFRNDLKMNRKRLQTTLNNVGLSDNPSHEEMRECFESKFPDISVELLSLVQRMDSETASLLESLEIDIKGKPDTLPEKASWQWRKVKGSFTHKKREKVIENLRHWNDDLRNALVRPEVPAEDDTKKVQDLKLRFNIKRSDAIRQCLASFHRALEYGFRCGCSTPHQAAIDLDWASYESNFAKTLKVAVSYDASLQGEVHDSWVKLGITSETVAEPAGPGPELLVMPPETSIKRAQPLDPLPPIAKIGTIQKSDSLRSKVRFGITRSFSRTTSPAPSPTAPTHSPAPLEALEPPPSLGLAEVPPAASAPNNSEITSLCDALCIESKPWALKRFLRDPKDGTCRHYSLRPNPTDSPDIIRAVPLKSLLTPREQRTRKRNPYLTLTAKQRLGIAATMAWSVLHLSCSPWLDEHDWDRKQMAIFVEKSSSGREMLSRHPCSAYVFSQQTSPEGPPDDEDVSGLIPNRTVFALGVLLIELCICEPVSAVQGDDGAPVSQVDDFKAALDRLDDVFNIAGDSYGNAARRCVRFSFDGQDTHNKFDFREFRKIFYEVVVAPVQATYLMFPGSSQV